MRHLIPASVLGDVRTFMEDRGVHGLEAAAMLAGRSDGNISRAVIPDQVGHRSELGVAVEITQRGKLELVSALGPDERWIARIHSHPYNAFHSSTDDRNPALTAEGSISIVVPFFGLGLREGIGACAVFVFRDGRWIEARPNDASHMTDPRVELAGVAGGATQSEVLARLDSVRIVLTIAEGRESNAEDAAGLVNLVNIGARIFPHWRLPEHSNTVVEIGVLGGGTLSNVLADTAERVRSQPVGDPVREFELCWGGTPSGPGLAVDASGWSCSLSPVHLPLAPQDGPPIGSLGVGCWAVGQLLMNALEPLGVAGHHTLGFRWNLLTYGLDVAPATSATEAALPPFVNAGCGSVGSSVIYAAVAAGLTGGLVDLVDPDAFTARNRGRYPILLHPAVDALKAPWLAEVCRKAGIAARPHDVDLARFTNETVDPPAIDLVVSSVDTIVGRRDATDLLARTTINVGVSGLAFHVSRHGFGEEGCAYCQYVDVAPALSGAQMLSEVVGLPVERIIALEHGDGRLSQADAAALAAGGRYGEHPPVAGSRLADLRRRAYAQA